MKYLSFTVAAVFLLNCKPKTQLMQNANLIDNNIAVLTSFPDYDPAYPPPDSIPSDSLFSLSQNYPKDYDSTKVYPWESFDFRTQSDAYGFAVLAYCLEGNLKHDFRVQKNDIRPWYHAPWLHSNGRQNGNGREYWHGLTRERATPPYELHFKQKNSLENWAIGFYNKPGGYTLGKVWLTESGEPDPSKATFPRGTVSFKLLFTHGNEDQVPFLANTKRWKANIYEPDSNKSCNKIEREDISLQLLQIDIAVKDPRAAPTNWVFGTFIYDAEKEGSTVWDRMQLVGLSWGDEVEVSKDLHKEGAFVNESLGETVLNEALIYDPTKTYDKEAYVFYHGLGGRLNGPVDNPISSCISCHSQAANLITADIEQMGKHMPLGNFNLNRTYFPLDEFEKYFSPVDGKAYKIPFDGNDYMSTDYSLQISVGIRNYYQSKRTSKAELKDLPTVMR